MQELSTLPQRDTEHESVLGIVFDLSPAQAAVLSCLCRKTITTGDELLAYSGVKPPIKVVVSRARAKLRTHGFDINSRISVGYWIDAAAKRGIEETVRSFLEGR